MERERMRVEDAARIPHILLLIEKVAAVNGYGLDGIVSVMFDAGCQPFVGVTVSRKENVVYSSTAPLERAYEMLVGFDRQMPELKKMSKSVEELAAEEYGVAVRELTIGQLEDYKEARKERRK